MFFFEVSMNIFFPKVKFEVSPMAQETRKIYSFCYPGIRKWDWSDRIYSVHPELKEKLSGVNNKKIFYSKCYAYIKHFKDSNKDGLEKSVQKVQKRWDKVERKYFKILSKHFEIDWPKNKKIIKAYVSVVPINPRHLDKWTFTVGYTASEQRKIQTTVHEILHFLYFEKWKEVFPESDRRMFDSPHLVWKLSEVLAPVIMNSNPDIQKIVKENSPGYKEFQGVKIGNKKLMKYFDDLYKKHLKSDDSFEDFLKKAWESVEKYKSVLEQI